MTSAYVVHQTMFYTRSKVEVNLGGMDHLGLFNCQAAARAVVTPCYYVTAFQHHQKGWQTRLMQTVGRSTPPAP
jgi:hypothetical protein